ncbi:hypothetical protein C8J57DRAFT_1283008 [Mycena rebaudengoi]|nr:hypothetical protein C8J57DRAFT_1283008 [Mycena rebaudengoi]
MAAFFSNCKDFEISGGVFNQITGGSLTQTFNSTTQQTTGSHNFGRRATADSYSQRTNNRRRGTDGQIPEAARGMYRGRGQRSAGGHFQSTRPHPTSSQTFGGQMGPPHHFGGANSPLALPDPRAESQSQEEELTAQILHGPGRNQGQRAGGSGQAHIGNHFRAPPQSIPVPIPRSYRNNYNSTASNFHRTMSEPEPETNNGDEGISSTHIGNHFRAPPQSIPVPIPRSHRNNYNSTASNFHRTMSEPEPETNNGDEGISSSPEDADETPVHSPSMKQRSLSEDGLNYGSSSSRS